MAFSYNLLILIMQIHYAVVLSETISLCDWLFGSLFVESIAGFLHALQINFVHVQHTLVSGIPDSAVLL